MNCPTSGQNFKVLYHLLGNFHRFGNFEIFERIFENFGIVTASNIYQKMCLDHFFAIFLFRFFSILAVKDLKDSMLLRVLF